ncbi:hypothetical protein [Cryobacterium soli]|uniref:hypothetical protein n=1 Tax=Cryobacterium soli TaxID=2220095 RepID=UPI0015E8D63C|nr:hypothetical protein [Cryobacterium soli]
MSHTYKSTIKGDDTTITVDEELHQLAEPGKWAEVVKLTAAEKKAEKEAAEKLASEKAEAEAEKRAEDEATAKTAAEALQAGDK